MKNNTPKRVFPKQDMPHSKTTSEKNLGKENSMF
jgi:hypothetical protein